MKSAVLVPHTSHELHSFSVEAEPIRFSSGACALGVLMVAASARGLCAITLGDERDWLVHELQGRFPRARLIAGDSVLAHWLAKVARLIESPWDGIDLPLDVRGTEFQRRVWQALREIPPGATRSYTEVARRIGRPAAVRAVAQACGANALAVVIPCHRVVASDGSLAGYRWGVERKRRLLERELTGREIAR